MRRNTLSRASRWIITLAALIAQPVLLYRLLPLLGESANLVSLIAPVTATLLFSWRAGIAATIVTVVSSAQVFHAFTTMSSKEGRPKAILSGVVIAILCLGTERLRRYVERRKLIEEELRRAKKMEAMGRLAGGIAHDINNTLNAIMASVFAHRQELAPYGADFPDLDNIAAACDRGAQLTRSLLGFTRKSDRKLEVVSINAVIQSVHALLARTANKNIQMQLRLDADPPVVLADKAQIETAVINLCINALDAMANGGTLTMSSGKQEENVFLCIEDTGIGMDRNVKERVFEPFFTTKAAGKGTGLGLSMVYGLVKAMSGRIVLDTAPGQGTSITLFFPRAADAPQTSLVPSSKSAPTNPQFLSGRIVLLIDDEPLVLRSGVRLLRALGCEVLSASTGQQGVSLVKERNGAVDLVIVDFVMPDMDGLAVIEDLHTIAPSIPVVLASGFTRDADRLECVREKYDAVCFLAKPYRSEELVSAAKELLRAQPHTGANAP